MTKSKLDNMTEAYKSTLNELHDLKDSALNWKLEYVDTQLLVWAYDEGWVLLGTLNDPLLPEPIAEKLSMDGVAAVNVMVEVCP